MNNIYSESYLAWVLIWMTWNTLLAFVPVFLARLIYRNKIDTFNYFLLAIWLFFVPNTIYLITDVIHVFSRSFAISNIFPQILMFSVYISVIGLAPYSYYYSLAPVIKKYQKFIFAKSANRSKWLSLLFGLIIAMGVAIGRFSRANSWDVFTSPDRMLGDVLHIFQYWESIFFLIGYSLALSVLNILILRRIKSKKGL